MMMFNNNTHLFRSVGFVFSLATVGLSTHVIMDATPDSLDLFDGKRQSAYEARFTQANPLNGVSIAAMGAFKYAVLGQAAPGALVGKDGWLFTAEEFEVTADFHENLSRSATEIARVHTLMKQKGITLIPVIVPDKAEVYASKLRHERPADIKNRRAELLSLLALRDVMAVDASKALLPNSDFGDSFIKDDTHWSPSGSRAVTRLIANQIAVSEIELTAATVTTTQGPAMEYDGDLLKFVPTGFLRAAFGPEQNQIDRYTTTIEAAGGLFGDPDVDVALVGTSFSAKDALNFAGFLQEELGADVLNFATEGQGPFTPMQAFLASDSFQNTPPKLVVWEIPARYTSKEMNQ